MLTYMLFIIFFFQAEDGIRDLTVTGVQTCALPICSQLDVSSVSLSTLKETLDPALDIFADVVLNPAFPQADFQRQQRQRVARIQREKVQPVQMALRVFPQLLYGAKHAYGNPLTGSGTEESVTRMTRDDLVRFHRTWFKRSEERRVGQECRS